MDPNLVKIMDANMYQIRKGLVTPAILQAKDYLTYILGQKVKQIELELDEFGSKVRSIAKQGKKDKREKMKETGYVQKEEVQATHS